MMRRLHFLKHILYLSKSPLGSILMLKMKTHVKIWYKETEFFRQNSVSLRVPLVPMQSEMNRDLHLLFT